MRTTTVAGSALAALVLSTPLHAQLVRADVVVRSGPVSGHVVINEPPHHHRPVVVYERPARVIVVERFRAHDHHRNWKRLGYREVTVYEVGGRYYDRYDRKRGGRKIVVYERGGRYYRDCDECSRSERRRDDDYRKRDAKHDRHHDGKHDRRR